jgi:hypothetical protein
MFFMESTKSDSAAWHKISYKGKTWVDARSFHNTDEPFTRWVQNKIKLFGFAKGHDFLMIDYGETGIIPGDAECLLSANAAILLAGVKDNPGKNSSKKEQPFINPFHIA